MDVSLFFTGNKYLMSYDVTALVSSRDASVTEEKNVWIPATEFLHMIESVEGDLKMLLSAGPSSLAANEKLALQLQGLPAACSGGPEQ
jgi:hypothetical protein